MRSPAFCLQCDDGTELLLSQRDLSFQYKGKTLVISSVRGWHCPVCGECEFIAGDGEAERHSAEIDAFAERVDAEESAWLRTTRKRLGLRQADAGNLFGGGASAFSEYERGKTQPHKSTILLLRLLDRHPELLDEIASLAHR
ncbi:MAG: YgiT-type zinc finger protein [Methylococcaceae bacterium]|nr:MAG: YgiT-type zinc finger protein [Methylococcaceae bacterium]